jgi:metal-responsive CopG/Arc/MetJ family transcriptional regulator
MAAKPVQVSIDGELLRRIDRDPEAKKLGRSAFIRNAVSTYLQAKERRDVDAAIRKAYEANADELLDEVESLVGAQAWPET